MNRQAVRLLKPEKTRLSGRAWGCSTPRSLQSYFVVALLAMAFAGRGFAQAAAPAADAATPAAPAALADKPATARAGAPAAAPARTAAEKVNGACVAPGRPLGFGRPDFEA